MYIVHYLTNYIIDREGLYAKKYCPPVRQRTKVVHDISCSCNFIFADFRSLETLKIVAVHAFLNIVSTVYK